ncbi:hypothetical protein PPL_11665 [Heterostelium album PN500]|uniref:Uncharacterized protein n=1 Tax=Heterostelium pallidum (strain ATCC 26659 / Pp 5 / PN500) TaxID=670386 RepID=D3BVD9_HETP5|nr:hypothetical protein PPL_11665 [Heterostelium album PN500]EFA74696.1 hypothetical protein PPL_11665 [Heterostelium album PN500]|eukprot:XP_020426830.1 hypothetical protein PPL_11665 [Heterostelium album PN500]
MAEAGAHSDSIILTSLTVSTISVLYHRLSYTIKFSILKSKENVDDTMTLLIIKQKDKNIIGKSGNIVETVIKTTTTITNLKSSESLIGQAFEGVEVEDKSMSRSLSNLILPKCIGESNINEINRNDGFILYRKYNLQDYQQSEKLPRQAFYLNGKIVITSLSVSDLHAYSVAFFVRFIDGYLVNNQINGMAPGESRISFGNNSFTADSALSIFPIPPNNYSTKPLVVEVNRKSQSVRMFFQKCRLYFNNPYINIVLGVHIWERQPAVNGSFNAISFYFQRFPNDPRVVRLISFGSAQTTSRRENKFLRYSGLQQHDLEGNLQNHPNPVIASVAPYIISIPAVDIFGPGHIYQNLPNLDFDLFQLKTIIEAVPDFSI